MINIIIAAIIVIGTAICKAITDKISHHFRTSIFFNKNHQFWDPKLSWLNKYHNNDLKKGINKKKFIPFSDGWHLVNSIQICLWISLILIPIDLTILYKILLYVGLGLLHIATFNLFYNRLLNKKNGT